MKTLHFIIAIAFTVLFSSGWACQRKAAVEPPPAVEETIPADETTAPEPQDDSLKEEGEATTDEGGES